MMKLNDMPPGLDSTRRLLQAAVLLGSELRQAAMPVMASACLASMGRPSPVLSFMLALAVELGRRMAIMPHPDCRPCRALARMGKGLCFPGAG